MATYQDNRTIMFQIGAIATDATSATTVDVLGYKRAQVEIFTSPATATNSSAKWTSLVLQHGITTDVTNFTAITGATGTTEATATATQFVLPVHNDATEAGIIRFNVDLVDKARHLRVVKQATASHHTTANSVNLFRSGTSPDSAADAGVDVIVNV